jgi:hypothetical protein
MARYSASATQTTARTASRGPTITVGNTTIKVVEVAFFATTAVATNQVALRRFSAAGTAGTAIDEVVIEPFDAPAPLAAVTQAPTADHTMVAGNIEIVHMPEMIGGGYIFTYDPGIVIIGGSGDGLVLTLPAGTDGLIDFKFAWEE